METSAVCRVHRNPATSILSVNNPLSPTALDRTQCGLTMTVIKGLWVTSNAFTPCLTLASDQRAGACCLSNTEYLGILDNSLRRSKLPVNPYDMPVIQGVDRQLRGTLPDYDPESGEATLCFTHLRTLIRTLHQTRSMILPLLMITTNASVSSRCNCFLYLGVAQSQLPFLAIPIPRPIFEYLLT